VDRLVRTVRRAQRDEERDVVVGRRVRIRHARGVVPVRRQLVDIAAGQRLGRPGVDGTTGFRDALPSRSISFVTMKEHFWVESWDQGGTKTSFHLPEVHPHAVLLAERGMLDDVTVLVPLCGRSVDMPYFARFARRVIGIELVPKAVAQFIDDNDLEPVEGPAGVFTSGNLEIRCADLFQVTPADLGPIDLVYDRASLIAFPEDMRERYVAKMIELTRPGSRYFINTIEYDPILPTPPFSVGPDQIERYYGADFEIEHVRRGPRPEHRMVQKFGLDHLTEHGFLLQRR
jgi:thiopurine S-methyltransferase